MRSAAGGGDMDQFGRVAHTLATSDCSDLGVHRLAEAFSAGSDPGPVAVEVGSRAAAQTVPWTELLAETEAAFAAIRTVTPYRVVRALSIAWVENSLQFAHEVSCEDPLTRLATLAHMRSRLDEVY